MSEIRIDIRNKIAVNPEPQRQVVVCGNSDYSIRFSFDAEWNAYNTKTARFAYNGQYQDVVFTGAVCSVPVMQGVHGFTVGVYAGNLHTTTPAVVFAKKSILCEAGAPADPVTSVYNQIMEEVGRKANSNHTHSYNDLTNKPDIPEAYDDTEVKQMIQGKAAANHTHSYNSLTDKPTIPTVDSNSINAALGIDVVQAIENAERQIDGLDEGKADADHVHSYNELQDKPVIPSAYDDTALAGRVTAIEGKEAGWNAKQDAIADLATIREGSALGATALQSHQDISGKADKADTEPKHGNAELIYSGTITEAVSSIYIDFGDSEGYRALLIKTYTHRASASDTLMCLFNETQRSTNQAKPILPINGGLQSNDTITRFAVALSVGGNFVGFSHGSGTSNAANSVNIQGSCTSLGQNTVGTFKSVLLFGFNGTQIPANSSFKIYGVKGGVI